MINIDCSLETTAIASTVPVLLTFLYCFNEIVADHDLFKVMSCSGRMGLSKSERSI